MRLVHIGICSLVLTISAYAETDPVANRAINSIQRGLRNDDKIRTLYVEGAATIGGAVTASSFTGAIAPANLSGLTVGSMTDTTNGHVISLSAGRVNILRAIGNANAASITNTFAPFAAADVGKVTYLVNITSATNTFVLPKTGVNVGTAASVAPGAVLTVIPVATNLLYVK